MILTDYFDRAFCINLDSRPDRWEEAQKEFAKHSFNVERIPGIEGVKMNLDFPPEIKEGAVGCALSQFFCIKYAKQLGLNSFLLLEDDIQFDENVNELFNQYITEVPSDWDMLYLGGQHFHGMNLTQVSEHVYKCEYTLAAHSVAFKSTVYDRFIDKLIDITKPCDVHYAESHREINAYVIIPHLTWQRNSYSDIEKVNVDYTFLKHHRYPQWGKPMTDTSTVKKKLNGMGPVLWINLDTETNRQEHMKSLLDYYQIPHTRISAVDGRGNNDVSEFLIGRWPDLVTSGELACTMSHLKAIKYFYEQTNLDYIIICEDDIVFDTVPYWPFTWSGFMSHAPYDWDVLQCAITSTKNLRANLHPRLINDFCAAFYVITRHHAEKILKLHVRGDKFRLDQKLKPRATSEEIIYNTGRTYSMPLFTYRYDFDSGIHQDHIEIFHKNNVEGVLNFWKSRPPEMGTAELLDYDFYGFWEPLVG